MKDIKETIADSLNEWSGSKIRSVDLVIVLLLVLIFAIPVISSFIK